MGRLPVLNPSPGEQDPQHPPETSEEGCPGAWYRCYWAASVARYERALGEHGFSENLHLSRSDDRLVLDAVEHLETERLRARNYDHRARARLIKHSHGNT